MAVELRGCKFVGGPLDGQTRKVSNNHNKHVEPHQFGGLPHTYHRVMDVMYIDSLFRKLEFGSPMEDDGVGS